MTDVSEKPVRYSTRWREAVSRPKSVSGRARQVARDTALSLAAMVPSRPQATFLRCLYCHYVFDDQLDDWERILVQLKRRGEFVSTERLIEMVTGSRAIDGRYFHLSFDDGFRNNYTNAFPVLRKHRIPAIFFIATAMMDGEWAEADWYRRERTGNAGTLELMKWSDVREMRDSGYEIGSHTRTHARLTDISGDSRRLEDELVGSKRDLETALGETCRYISWPYGGRQDADVRSLNAVQQAGYEACFGAYRGSVVSGKTDRFQIPRHHFEAHWPLRHILYFAEGHMERTGSAAER